MSSRKTFPFERTLEVRERCVCLAVQRTSRALARRFDEALRPAGLTNEQFSLLMACNRPEAAQIRQLADLLGTDRTTLTAALKLLLRRGLITMAADATDGRVRRITLTPEGHALLLIAYPLWEQAHNALEAEYGADKTFSLRLGLDSLSAKCNGRP